MTEQSLLQCVCKQTRPTWANRHKLQLSPQFERSSAWPDSKRTQERKPATAGRRLALLPPWLVSKSCRLVARPAGPRLQKLPGAARRQEELRAALSSCPLG
jgi:hypothetical protein